jgi:hypothetical protein
VRRELSQTLWDSHWMVGARALEYGFIPALGLAGPWTLLMVGVHTVFSISAPIAGAVALLVVAALRLRRPSDSGTAGPVPWGLPGGTTPRRRIRNLVI